jgi:hypothetical protein
MRKHSLRNYCVCLIDTDQIVKKSVFIYCREDEEACTQALRGLEPDEHIEVWDRCRLVFRGDASKAPPLAGCADI